jgi:hypothetical protein
MIIIHTTTTETQVHHTGPQASSWARPPKSMSTAQTLSLLPSIPLERMPPRTAA